MDTLDPTIEQDGVQPVRIADVRQTPLDELAADVECADMVSRVVRRQQYAWRVDVAGFSSGI